MQLAGYPEGAYGRVGSYHAASWRGQASPLPNWSYAVAVVGAACVFLGMGGTGGNITVRGAVSSQHTAPAVVAGIARSERTREEDSDHPDALAVSEQLDRIKSTLKLTTSDLANTLGVSRPTVYNWAKGAEPSGDALLHLQFLAAEAQKIHSLSLTRPNALLKRPLFDGKSALDILQSGITLSPLQLRALAVLDEKELNSRSRAKGLGPVRSHVDAIEEQGNSYGWDSTN